VTARASFTGAHALPVAVLLLSASLWGLAWWPLKAFADAGLSGPMLALLTYGALGLAGLPWLWRERTRWQRQATLLLLIALVGGWGNAAFVGALVIGDVVRVMLLFYLAPVWSVIGGRLFLGEAISWRRGAAVALAVAGAFLVVGGAQALGAPPTMADLLALTAGMGFAGNNIASRAAQEVPTASKTVALCLGCALVCVPLLAGNPLAWPAFDAPLAGALVAYTFVGLLLVIVTWQWSVTRLEAGRAGVISLAELLVAVVSAVVIGGEVLAPREWAGGALILAAAVLEATDTGSPSKGEEPCAASS